MSVWRRGAGLMGLEKKTADATPTRHDRSRRSWICHLAQIKRRYQCPDNDPSGGALRERGTRAAIPAQRGGHGRTRSVLCRRRRRRRPPGAYADDHSTPRSKATDWHVYVLPPVLLQRYACAMVASPSWVGVGSDQPRSASVPTCPGSRRTFEPPCNIQREFRGRYAGRGSVSMLCGLRTAPEGEYYRGGTSGMRRPQARAQASGFVEC
ncbi:hypothetical protein C8Q80DRAFT_636426 [Daedaleopsis nitida]|nr:hypothetical protein C8Q80DRAFT_636426 [Daedaleopsis nitida]